MLSTVNSKQFATTIYRKFWFLLIYYSNFNDSQHSLIFTLKHLSFDNLWKYPKMCKKLS